MNNTEYMRKAMRTAGNLTKDEKLLNAALGLCGESGEFADHIKKHTFQGHNLDENYLINELGDIYWYLALAANALGYTISEIMTININKLQKRYPGKGFDSERSINRKD